MEDARANHDIIVLGASAGGVEALMGLVRDLPADLPAAVFAVLHVGATSHLAAILDREGPLSVTHAETGQRIERGHVYVAPPGRHMLLHAEHILLRRGPRENRARPAIDPLFRSAACSFGARVVAVVLTGLLNDGTAGLLAVKRCGGVAVVQDPRDATAPSMPRSAAQHVQVDHCVPLAEMGGLLARLAREHAGESPEVPIGIRIEAAIAAQELSGMNLDDRLGAPSRFSCPECHGTLWEIADADLLRYRCHVGHAFTADAVLEGQDQESEQLLWQLLRSHQERAALTRRMADKERQRKLSDQLRERASEYDEDAELVRQLLKSVTATPAERGPSEPGARAQAGSDA